jgi:hypothetical protein
MPDAALGRGRPCRLAAVTPKHKAWALSGKKRPLQTNQIEVIPACRALAVNLCTFALVYVAIDSKLCGFDFVVLKVLGDDLKLASGC